MQPPRSIAFACYSPKIFSQTDKMIVWIFSSPRSGSTWLGKIFDSHPGVFYLHEPDIADRGLDLIPYWSSGAEGEDDLDRARKYIARLLSARTLRATGSRPYFRKEYRSPLQELIRRALICGSKAYTILNSEHSAGSIPDMTQAPPELTVIKTVSALGRVRVLLEAQTNIIPILLIRHPIEYVYSRMRGIAGGHMEPQPTLEQLEITATAKRIKIPRAALLGGTTDERLAWEWLIANSEAYDAIISKGGIVLSYNALNANPHSGARALFSKLGLAFPRQTENFLQSHADDGRYYSVVRKPSAVSAWMTAMDSAEISRIQEIISLGMVGQMFLPLERTISEESIHLGMGELAWATSAAIS